MSTFITGNIEISSDDPDRENRENSDDSDKDN